MGKYIDLVFDWLFVCWVTLVLLEFLMPGFVLYYINLTVVFVVLLILFFVKVIKSEGCNE